MAKWYVWCCSALVAFSGFLWGYDVGSVNGVKEMRGYRVTFNISYTETWSADNGTEQCSSSDDVDTSALLGLIVTVLVIGSFIGSLLSGALSDLVGRKVTLLIGAGCCLLGASLQTGAFFIWMIILGRLCYGLGIGIFFQVTPVYIAEIAPRELRGRLVSAMFVLSTTGILLGILINVPNSYYLFGWRITLGIPVIAALILLIAGSIFLPQSPRYLMKKQRYSKALMVLKRIHQDDSIAEREVEDIRASLDNGTKEKMADILKYLLTWTLVKRIMIGFFLQLLVRLAGSMLIWYYSVTLLCHIGIQGYLGSIALGGSVWLTQFIGVVLVDKVGRKPILLVCGVCLVVFLSAIGTLVLVFNLEDSVEEGYTYEQIVAGYFVLVFMVLFISVYSLSFGNVPNIICSEIFPLRARGISTALTYTGMWIGAVFVSQVSPILIVSPLGVHGTYYLMAGVCILLFLFVLFLIPETKGRSLEEIDVLFEQSLWKRANLAGLWWWCERVCWWCQRKGVTLVPSEDGEALQLSFSSKSDSTETLDSDESEQKIETNV